MQQAIRTTLLSFLLALVALAPLQAGGEKGASLSGQVVDARTGEALAGCRLEVEGTDILIFSDLDGHFQLPKLRPGKYRLRVTMVSYEDLTTSTIALNPGQQETLSLGLDTFR